MALGGGVYGFDFSLVGLVLMSATGFLFLWLAVRRGKIMRPFWTPAG